MTKSYMSMSVERLLLVHTQSNPWSSGESMSSWCVTQLDKYGDLLDPFSTLLSNDHLYQVLVPAQAQVCTREGRDNIVQRL